MTFAVVYSPGRTGSNIISNNLAVGPLNPPKKWPVVDNSPSIIHCHNPFYQPPSKTICIVSKRRNIFDALISREVSYKIKEFYFYSKKSIEPFKVNVDQFYKAYVRHVSFYKILNLEHRKNFEIYFEDLISDPYHLFSKFGINKKINLELSNKSPYNYKDVIHNYAELLEAFQSFKVNDFADELFEWAKIQWADYVYRLDTQIDKKDVN